MKSSFQFTGEIFKKMMYATEALLQRKQAEIDAINVFPVPDGDTGSNMYMTIRRVIEELNKAQPKKLQDTVKVVAKGAFLGARGNSGVILSQFLMGFSKPIIKAENVTPQIVITAFKKGSERAYRAVSNPAEGTILTVIRETAEALEKLAKEDNLNWETLFQKAHEYATISLAKTPELMPRLKEAGVVDAGAQGFVYLLQSWNQVVNEPDLIELPDESPDLLEEAEVKEKIYRTLQTPHSIEQFEQEAARAHVKSLDELKFRYCTEAICETTTLTADKLRELTKDMGDSTVIVEIEGAVRIHIHTNNPQQLFDLLAKYGQVTYTKAEDMLAQHKEALHSKYITKEKANTTPNNMESLTPPKKELLQSTVHQ